MHPDPINAFKHLGRRFFVIGVHAPKGTGKDTTTMYMRKALTSGLEMHASISAMADPLYAAVSILTGLPVDWLQDQANKNRPMTPDDTPVSTLWGKTPRSILEIMGTEVVRDRFGVDHWCELKKQVLAREGGHTKRALLSKEAAANPVIHFIADIRFPNETALCDAVIELRRDGIEYGTKEWGDHPSTWRLPSDLLDETIWLERGSFTDETILSYLRTILPVTMTADAIDRKAFRKQWVSIERQREKEEREHIEAARRVIPAGGLQA